MQHDHAFENFVTSLWEIFRGNYNWFWLVLLVVSYKAVKFPYRWLNLSHSCCSPLIVKITYLQNQLNYKHMILQGNARRLLEKRCDGNRHLGRLSKLRLAPVLWCIILLLLVTYTQSVIMGVSFDLFMEVNCAIPSR